MLRDTIPWEDAELPILDEPRMAEWHRARGARTTERRGRHWVEIAPGFFQPAHHLARLKREEVMRPVWWCVSLRARLEDADARYANGSITAHLLPSPGEYAISRLSARRRQQINRALRQLEIVVLREPRIALGEGYRVAKEAKARNPLIALADYQDFCRQLVSFFDPPRGVIFAALR